MKPLSHSFHAALTLILAISVSMTANRSLAQNSQGIAFTEAQRKEIESVLIENSKKINRSLPIMVDSETRLDTTLAVGMQMHFKYTMVNLTSDLVDAKSFQKQMEAIVIKSQQADKNAMLMLRAGLVCFYNVFDKNGVLITQMRIDGPLCGIK